MIALAAIGFLTLIAIMLAAWPISECLFEWIQARRKIK